MNFKLNNGINRVKKTLTSLLILGVLATGSLEIILPHSTEADFSVDNSSLLNDNSTAQENTILQSNPIDSSNVIKRIKMVVTAYSSTVEETDSTPFITASSTTVREGVVANNLLPFGTEVRIPELYGDKIFTVEDRMSHNKGKYHLDIWMPSHGEAEKFGSEISYVEVLKN